MTVHALNHYNLRAPQPLLDQLRDFYVDVVGLSAGERPPFRSFGYWLYADGRDLLHLMETPAGETRETHIATTFDHVAFTCSGHDETVAHLEQCGVEFRTTEIPLLQIRQIFLRDPAGNGVEMNFPVDERV